MACISSCACAWLMRSCCANKQSMPAGIVDVDGTRVSATRKKVDLRTLTKEERSTRLKAQKGFKQRVQRKRLRSDTHTGRLLLLSHGSSSSSGRGDFAFPLPPVQTKRGPKRGAPSPAESKAEVLPVLQRKLSSDKHLVGSDAGKGLVHACKDFNLAHSIAKHAQGEFTPVTRLPADAVPAKVRVAVGKASSRTWKANKMLQNSGSHTKVVGGGQKCESLASKIKRSLRRENKMGRKRVKVCTQHVDPLATLWLSNNPGLLDAVHAVACYRKALQDKVPPQTAFVDLSWLEEPAT